MLYGLMNLGHDMWITIRSCTVLVSLLELVFAHSGCSQLAFTFVFGNCQRTNNL